LRFLKDKIPGTAPVRVEPTFGIASKSFLRELNVRPGRYEADWDEEKKILACVYNVSEPVLTA